MNNENLQNEKKFRQFLLGQMPEDERVKFEVNFIADEDLFENLRVSEEELIEEYVLGTLSEDERKLFETNFLTTMKKRERVEFTRRTLKDFAEKSALKKPHTENSDASFWAKITKIFRRPQIAFASVLTILAAISGIWFFGLRQDSSNDLVKISPTPISASSPVLPEILENTNQTEKNLNSTQKNSAEKTANNSNNLAKNNNSKANLQKETEKEKPFVSTIVLFSGGVRSGGKNNELNLPKNSGGANLQLNLENAEYRNYRAEIINQNGEIVYRNGSLTGNKTKINVFVPAKNLKRGDYIVKLYGKNADGNEEPAADYQFRVNQK